jgi:hypothetical protein
MLLVIFNLQVVVVGCPFFFFFFFFFLEISIFIGVTIGANFFCLSFFLIDGYLSLFDIFLVASVLAHMGGCAKSVCIYECIHVVDLRILEGS